MLLTQNVYRAKMEWIYSHIVKEAQPYLDVTNNGITIFPMVSIFFHPAPWYILFRRHVPKGQKSSYYIIWLHDCKNILVDPRLDNKVLHIINRAAFISNSLYALKWFLTLKQLGIVTGYQDISVKTLHHRMLVYDLI